MALIARSLINSDYGRKPCNPGFFIEIQISTPTSHLQFLVRQLLTHYHPQYHHRKTSFLWWQHD